MDTAAPTETTTSTVYGETRVDYSDLVSMDIEGRTIYVSHFATASEYSTPSSTVYWVTGWYAKKDGSVGKTRAHNLVGGNSLPADVLAALNA